MRDYKPQTFPEFLSELFGVKIRGWHVAVFFGALFVGASLLVYQLIQALSLASAALR